MSSPCCVIERQLAKLTDHPDGTKIGRMFSEGLFWSVRRNYEEEYGSEVGRSRFAPEAFLTGVGGEALPHSSVSVTEFLDLRGYGAT